MDVKTNEIIQRKATIFNIQRFSIYDGPGVRTVIFFKGCPLRCKWCSNPEGLERKYQVMYKKNFCINCMACTGLCPVKKHKIDISRNEHQISRDIDCIGCRKCEQICPKSALSIVGEQKTVEQLYDVALEDEMFYATSGGGVTLGGGECTLQGDFIKSLLKALKSAHINTAIETSGYTDTKKILEIGEYVDLFLFDIKNMNPVKHNELTGVSNEKILNNLSELLKTRHKVKVRMPMLKGINDSEEEIRAVIDFLFPFKDYPNFMGVDLLPYHKLGVNKYEQLDKEYLIDGDPSLSEEDLDKIESMLKKYEFNVNVIRH